MRPTPVSVLFRRALLTLPAVSLVVACAAEPIQQSLKAGPTAAPATQPAAPVQSQSPAPAPAPAAAAMARPFGEWLAEFRQEALSAGISAAVFDRAFAGMTPDLKIIEADRSQPEFNRPVWDYLDSAMSAQRVATGRRLLRQHATTLERIERQYGVDRHALVAIWGMESNFGQIMGSKSVIRSLATLAHEGRRPEFARAQLIAALRILEQGDVRAERMQGSWAGAMGQTQFIPTTFQDYAVDFDGDGRRDIWDSEADALASAAHYLQKSGWQARQRWGHEVKLPTAFDYSLADPEVRKTAAEWRSLGITGVPTMAADDTAALLLPAGHRGPAFLVFGNFRSVLRYNNSSSYALAVNLLAERFQGDGGIEGSWPRNDRPLNRSERIELQERLAGLGLNPGTADSIIGANTRRAIRAYQQKLGWPADGYPTHQLLQRLRQEPLEQAAAG